MNHLTVDAGNSQLAFVLYRGQERLGSLRIRTKPQFAPEEIRTAWQQLLQEFQFSEEQCRLTISSVVPRLENNLRSAADISECSSFHWVGWNSPHGFTASESAGREIGADIISGLVGASEFAQPPFVVVDSGTATTLTLVDQSSHIMGVAILPGLVTQMLSLTRSAPHLPQEVSLHPPPNAYGNNTEESLQSGILYGHAGSIEAILARYRGHFNGQKLSALACGGLFHRISSLCPTIDIEETELVNIGCRILSTRIGQEGL
ncbi:MAG TPA: type III pantothenate kinase [Phycisphaerales bacterium]|nr:type III pantothenate kinase [Phycisphaerales bacterium]